jgi:hypothetical protein
MHTGVHEKQRGMTEQDRDITIEEIILEKNGRIFQYATFFLRADVWKDEPAWVRLFPVGDFSLALNCAAHGKVRMLADVMAIYRFAANGSWTVRSDNDAMRTRTCERMIEGLLAFDEATGYKHNKYVTQRINRHKYTIALMQHDLKALRSDDLNEIFRSRPLKYRMNDVFRCACPKVYNTLVKPLAKVLKSHDRS